MAEPLSSGIGYSNAAKMLPRIIEKMGITGNLTIKVMNIAAFGEGLAHGLNFLLEA